MDKRKALSYGIHEIFGNKGWLQPVNNGRDMAVGEIRVEKTKRFFWEDYHDTNWDRTVYLTANVILGTLEK